MIKRLRLDRPQAAGSTDTGFLRDSTKLGLASGVAVLGYATQIALITHVLGLDEYGVFAIVVSTVDLVGRLFDFRSAR